MDVAFLVFQGVQEAAVTGGFCIPNALAYGIGMFFLSMAAAIGKLWFSVQAKETKLNECMGARIAYSEGQVKRYQEIEDAG